MSSERSIFSLPADRSVARGHSFDAEMFSREFASNGLDIGANGANHLYRAVYEALAGEQAKSLRISVVKGGPADLAAANQRRAPEYDPGRIDAAVNCAVTSIVTNRLAPRKPKSLAIIGSGPRARVHAVGVAAVRNVTDIRIFDRRIIAAREMGMKLRRITGTTPRLAQTPEEAVHGADMVVISTADGFPAIESDWIRGDVFVISAGPRFRQRHELPLSLAARARAIVSDNIEAIGELGESFFLSQQSMPRPIEQIGAYLGAPGQADEQGVKLFLAHDRPSVLDQILVEEKAQPFGNRGWVDAPHLDGRDEGTGRPRAVNL